MPRRDYFIDNFHIMQVPPPPPPPPPPAPPPFPTNSPMAGIPFFITGFFSPGGLGLRLQALLQRSGLPVTGWTDITPVSGTVFQTGNFTVSAGTSYVLECSLGINGVSGWVEYAFSMCEFDVVTSPTPTSPLPELSSLRVVNLDEGATAMARSSPPPAAPARPKSKGAAKRPAKK
jgi:hypothetical protein